MGDALAEDIPYLPDQLKRGGYKTAAFVGALVLDPEARAAPGFERGFDTYDAGFHAPADGEDRYHSLERRAGDVVSHAVRWLNRPRQGPFFVWIHLYDPHDPYDPPEPFKTKYKSAPYDGEIAYTDAMVGKLISALQSRGLYRNTLIAVMADHGEAFGEHGEQRHGIFLYDETVHVPLLFKLPVDPVGGKRLERRVGLVDVAPTILKEAGVAIPPRMQGSSLAEEMTTSAKKKSSPPADAAQSVYSETDYGYRSFGWSRVRAWRTSKYFYVQSPKRELYDETEDQKAEQNLAGSAPAVADTLDTQLNQFHEKTSSAATGQAKHDAVAVANLRALGYLASDNSPALPAGAPAIDPKDKIEIANLMHQALVNKEEEHYDEAIPRLQRIIQDAPEVSTAYLELGHAFVHEKKFSEAIPPLQKAVEKMPDSGAAHYELGFAMANTGDWQGALPQLEAAVASAPDSAEMHFYLGAVYEQLQDTSKATKEYRETLNLNPDHFKANLMLGRLYGMRRNPAAALPLLERAVKLQPNSPDAHNFLGNVYSDLGDMEKARNERMKGAILKAQQKGQPGDSPITIESGPQAQ